MNSEMEDLIGLKFQWKKKQPDGSEVTEVNVGLLWIVILMLVIFHFLK